MGLGTSRAGQGAIWLVAGSLALAGCKGSTTEGTAVAPQPSSAAAADTPAARKAMGQPFTVPPAVKKNLYPPIEEAAKDIDGAEKQAAAQGKRVLLDFGGDWCGDCQVLDIYFHQEPNASLLNKNFVKVNVNIGHEDANVDLAKRYGVPLQGVPALAVLAPNGKLLYSQNKEFSDMRYMEPSSVTEFLNQWKPGSGSASSSPASSSAVSRSSAAHATLTSAGASSGGA